MKNFQQNLKKLEATDTQVLGVSMDSPFANRAFAEQIGVTFPLFAKIDVNGNDTAPIYKYLKHAKPGLLGSEAIKWNFTKFLVDRTGNVVERYAPNAEPESLAPDIQKLL